MSLTEIIIEQNVFGNACFINIDNNLILSNFEGGLTESKKSKPETVKF